MAAAPDAFRLQPATDLAASFFDPAALAIHLKVVRWAHDEFPLPGQLFEEVLELLYREDRFLQGTLQVGARRTAITNVTTPIMAVINPVGRVVPPDSILAGLAAAPAASCEVLEYESDRGPMIQHLGPLAARSAHERLWPKILDWAHQVSCTSPGV
jgi:polyhydroxyalkanoate synthase